MSGSNLSPGRLTAGDVLRVGAVGLRTRPLRALLSALGIALGVAAMLAVVGISASGRADLQGTLDALGTNLLTASAAGDSGHGEDTRLPDGAVARIERIAPVTDAAALRRLPDDISVYRHDRVPVEQTNGIVAYVADLDLPDAIGFGLARGAWLNAATARYPAVVLGTNAANRLGITDADPGRLVYLGGAYFAVVGILEPVSLVPELDSAALVGPVAAERYLGAGDDLAVTVYLRTADDRVSAVRDVLSATANPAAPYLVVVSRPSDALAAKIATERALNGLLLGLGAVALLVGGVGVANTMVISVLERRAEIGLRRALGATRGHVRTQFLTESSLLATLGGLGGVALGVLATAGYALTRGWPLVVPTWATTGGIAATSCVGAIAGLFPALRAAHLSPTEALGAV